MDYAVQLVGALGQYGFYLALAAVAFLFLRGTVANKEAPPSTRQLERHALTVGVFGWMASSLVEAGTFYIRAPDAPTHPLNISGILVPIVLALLLHTVGQLSYPGNRGQRRVAVLEQRRVRDFLPRTLSITTAAIALLSLVPIIWVAFLPGYAPVAELQIQDAYFGPRDGQIPGQLAASVLIGGWLLLTIGTLLVLLLMTRRPNLNGLDHYGNAMLRTLAMNRLLRLVATMFSGLAMGAVSYLTFRDPSEPLGSYTNYWGILGMAVLVVMWAWPHPRLDGLSYTATDGSQASWQAGSRTHEPALSWHNAAIHGIWLAAVVALVTALILDPIGINGSLLFAVAGAGLVLNLWYAAWAWPASRAARQAGLNGAATQPLLGKVQTGFWAVAIAIALIAMAVLIYLQQRDPAGFVRSAEPGDSGLVQTPRSSGEFFEPLGSADTQAAGIPAEQLALWSLILAAAVLATGALAAYLNIRATLVLPLPERLGSREKLAGRVLARILSGNLACLLCLLGFLSLMTIQPQFMTNEDGQGTVTWWEFNAANIIAPICFLLATIAFVRAALNLNSRAVQQNPSAEAARL